jgi:predicted nucleic acid-binding protein
VAARADVLVTGDKGLLHLREFRNIPIITSRTFLDMLPDLS